MSNKKQKTLLNYFSAKAKNEPKVVMPSEVSSDMKLLSIEQPIEEEVIPRKRTKKIVLKSDSDTSLEQVIRTKRKRLRKRIIQSDDDNDDDKSTMKHTEKEDIIDDLNFLDKSDILNERTRGKQVSRYSEALKKLKDRKSKLAQYDKGQKGPIDDYAAKNSDTDSEDSDSDIDSEEEDSEEEESDFVVDDDMIDGEKTTVQEAMMELPPEFSKGRMLSFKRQLEIYIEYLVRLVLNPVFDSSTSTRYDLAKKAVMKRIQGYKDSIVTSDVWLSSFKSTVDKYSKWIQTKDIVYDSAIKCEACRTNKPAGVKIILSDSNDELDSTVLYLGTECCKKGEMYHYFKHFASHMFAKVKTIVEEMRNLGIQDPSSIYTQMLAVGYIKKLTREVQNSFNITIRLYNIKGHRSRIEDSSSSEDTSSSE